MSDSTDIPNGYKATELGVLPEEWDVVPLSEAISEIDLRLSEVENPVTNRFQVLSLTKNFGLIWQSERFEKRIATIDVSKYKVVKKGQIVYNPYVIWEGAVHILRYYDEGLVSPVYPIWEAKIGIADPFFIDHNLRTPYAISEYNRLAAGAVNRRRSIRKPDFLKIKIPLPPLPEQHAIAATLRSVQEAKEKTDAVIAATKALMAAMMKHLFMYGPVPPEEAERVALKETKIGSVPEEWNVVKIGEIIQKTQYGLSIRGEQVGQYPILRMNNLGNGLIDTNDLQYVNIDENNLHNFQLNRGDILFNRTNSYELVGKTSIFKLEETFVFASYLVRIIPDFDKIFPEYLNYYLNWGETQARLKLLASRGVSQSNINATKLRDFSIPFPSLSIQKQIAIILNAIDQKLAAEQSRKETLNLMFASLLHNLMTAKTRVKNIV